jgi:hypothetical protein
MAADGSPRAPDAPGRMEISLTSIHQLFNSLDPAPFYEKDLDTDAEHYLASWAKELPKDAPLTLTLHLREPLPADRSHASIAQAIGRHFGERARLAQADLDELFDQGRISLMIGLPTLAAFLLLAQVLAGASSSVFAGLLRESFAIAGWVAMWRPMQIYLYDWWPLRDRVRLFKRMSQMPVTIRAAG